MTGPEWLEPMVDQFAEHMDLSDKDHAMMLRLCKEVARTVQHQAERNVQQMLHVVASGMDLSREIDRLIWDMEHQK